MKRDKINTPVPDLAYGLRDKAFTKAELAFNITYDTIARLSPDMNYPFFLVEFKSHKGSIEEAQNQACRGGAAVMSAMRKLKKMAGLDDLNAEGDKRRMVFTMAMVPSQAQLYVHWAETISKDEDVYHMNLVMTYALQDEDSVPQLKKGAYNILEWGIYSRKNYIKELISKVKEMGSGGKVPVRKAPLPTMRKTRSQAAGSSRCDED